jgi:hypothetical protein
LSLLLCNALDRELSRRTSYSERTVSTRHRADEKEFEMIKTLAVMVGAVLLAPAIASAQATNVGFKYVGGEAGWAYVGASAQGDGAKARVETQPTASNDGFKYVGGEAGWAYESRSKIVWENGRLVHAADCPVLASLNAPREKVQGNAPLPPEYAGA